MDYAQALWEIESIKRLKARYYRLQDQNRWDEWALCFTDDCEIGSPLDPDVVVRGRDEIARQTAATAEPSIRAHRGTMPDIELLDEHTARGTWALYCAAELSHPDAPPTHAYIYGYYTDEYRKDVDGQWRIRRMRYDNDLTIVAGTPLPSAAWQTDEREDIAP